MTPTELSERATHTVLYFRPNRFDTYRNTQTGVFTNSGSLAFDCGHTYTWRPWGADRNPRRGDRDMCARCLEECLAEVAQEVK